MTFQLILNIHIILVLHYVCKHIVAMLNHFVIWKILKYYYSVFVFQTYYTSVYSFTFL